MATAVARDLFKEWMFQCRRWSSLESRSISNEQVESDALRVRVALSGGDAAGGVVCKRLYSVLEAAPGRSEIDDQWVTINAVRTS